MAQALGGRQEEDAAGAERVVEGREEPVLQFRLEVDEEVPAGEQVEPREGGVLDDVLDREHHHLPDLLLDPVPAFHLHEVAAQPLGPDVLHDVGRVDPGARGRDGVLVEVGRVDLDLEVEVALVHQLVQQDGDGVGLLSGGAARHPGAQDPALRLPGDEPREHLGPERLERLRIPEEAGDVDEQLLEQELHLGGMLLQVAAVEFRGRDVVLRHAALDPADDRALLVLGEVVAGPRAEDGQDLAQAAGHGRRRRHGSTGTDSAGQRQDRLRHPLRRQDLGHVPRANRHGGHPVVPGRGRVLREGDPARSQYGPQSEGAVGPRSREDHPHRALPLVLGQRAEECVDGHALPTRRLRHAQLEDAVEEREVAVGRDDVDAVGPYRQLIGHLDHGQGRRALDDLGEDALVAGVEVRDQHERHPGVGWHVTEELLERLQSSRGCSQPDDGEPERPRARRELTRDPGSLRRSHGDGLIPDPPGCPSRSPLRGLPGALAGAWVAHPPMVARPLRRHQRRPAGRRLPWARSAAPSGTSSPSRACSSPRASHRGP